MPPVQKTLPRPWLPCQLTWHGAGTSTGAAAFTLPGFTERSGPFCCGLVQHAADLVQKQDKAHHSSIVCINDMSFVNIFYHVLPDLLRNSHMLSSRFQRMEICSCLSNIPALSFLFGFCLVHPIFWSGHPQNFELTERAKSRPNSPRYSKKGKEVGGDIELGIIISARHQRETIVVGGWWFCLSQPALKRLQGLKLIDTTFVNVKSFACGVSPTCLKMSKEFIGYTATKRYQTARVLWWKHPIPVVGVLPTWRSQLGKVPNIPGVRTWYTMIFISHISSMGLIVGVQLCWLLTIYWFNKYPFPCKMSQQLTQGWLKTTRPRVGESDSRRARPRGLWSGIWTSQWPLDVRQPKVWGKEAETHLENNTDIGDRDWL